MVSARGVRAVLLVLAVAWLAVACSKPQPPKITPHSARVASVTPTHVVLALELRVDNPNPFPLVVRRVTGKLTVGSGIEVGSGASDVGGSIPARSDKIVPSELAVRWTQVTALTPLAMTGAPVPYVFRGVAVVGGEKLSVDVPFEVVGQLTREQVIQAGLRGLGGLLAPQ